ncbi:MAG: 50S ribosomal protein L6 [Chlorobi bacterium]|nr:MAG: 50S ribosomal protein L6 [Chlorobi bacterium OLB7]MBK8911487.1 50S ribosomal protein L6 [Chlorobiota bacterium]MBX7215812.1 50S ribosomal protein L6 [Candidatus Kapabacteria bacterium]
MSRIGKKPVAIPNGVTVKLTDGAIMVKGPKGELSTPLHPAVNVAIENNEVVVTRPNDLAISRAAHGLMRTLIFNMVQGVTEGYSRRLDIVGVGYRAELKGQAVQMNIGYSHPIFFFPPSDITIEVPQPTAIVIKGIDKQLVGQVAAKLRSFRPPEPYKGKGIKYENEQIRRKAGKSAGK